MYILVPLFTALIAAGTFIKIPMVPVPITLQTLFVFLSALLLSPGQAAASVALYLAIGALGLPIFTSGGGIAAMLGPTGGFLIAMLPAAFIGSIIVKKDHSSIIKSIIALLAMEAVIYIIGITWLKVQRDLTLTAALMGGLVPFIPGDIIKIAVAVIAAKYLYPEKEKLVERRKARAEE